MEKVKNPQLKILVADDDEGIRSGFAMLFKMYDYQVVVASNGVLALQAFENEAFDLVVTDICMPGGDGLTLIKALKGINKNIRIIAISGGVVPYEDSMDMALSLGADVALPKPISTLKLIEVVKHLLEGSGEDLLPAQII